MKTRLKIVGLGILLILVALTSIIWLTVWIVNGFNPIEYIFNKIKKLEL